MLAAICKPKLDDRILEIKTYIGPASFRLGQQLSTFGIMLAGKMEEAYVHHRIRIEG